jgi:L-histidine N-alpha-methyltransferase
VSASTHIDIHLDADSWQATRAADVARTLTQRPRSLDPLWFYDDRGSDLFDQITRLPEYYQTRAERSLLQRHAPEITSHGTTTLVELGSGTSDKTTTLLDAMADHRSLERYVPFDVSEETLRVAAAGLSERYPDLQVHGVVGDFHHHLDQIPDGGRRLLAFLGGTIGNLRPDQRSRFFQALRGTLGSQDLFLVGIDLVKDPARIVAAYDDAAGVTADFNRNALVVLNRELDANFEPEAFEHVARWNDRCRWIEMWLRATEPQQVRIGAIELEFHLDAGEELLTEISAKFSVEDFQAELRGSGFEPVGHWVAAGDEFALVLANPMA